MGLFCIFQWISPCFRRHFAGHLVVSVRSGAAASRAMRSSTQSWPVHLHRQDGTMENVGREATSKTLGLGKPTIRAWYLLVNCYITMEHHSWAWDWCPKFRGFIEHITKTNICWKLYSQYLHDVQLRHLPTPKNYLLVLLPCNGSEGAIWSKGYPNIPYIFPIKWGADYYWGNAKQPLNYDLIIYYD